MLRFFCVVIISEHTVHHFGPLLSQCSYKFKGVNYKFVIESLKDPMSGK